MFSKTHCDPRRRNQNDRTRWLSWASLALTAMCVLPAHSQSHDEKEIRALENRLVVAVDSKDVDAIMQGYAPGTELFVFDLGLPRQHTGWNDYKRDWEDFFKVVSGPIKLDIRDLSITAEGNFAYSHCIQHVVWSNKEGSKTELNASVTDVYRKIAGKWLIVQEHLSVPIHIASGMAEMMSKP